MGFALDSRQYVEYLKKVSETIAREKDYITSLDAATGDGDHWINLNMGFEAVVNQADELAELSLSDLLKKTGNTIMSVVGGSSGILYGSAYLAMGRTAKNMDHITRENLGQLIEAMMEAMMKRGNSQPGQKTMIDTLDGAVRAYRAAMDRGADDRELLEALAEGARSGAESTKDMEAVRGRACYQANKGVGHLDPGAVTMSMQLEVLAQAALDTV